MLKCEKCDEVRKTSWKVFEKSETCEEVEPVAGLEPATHALRKRCSTN
jgi:hypothetical protein